MTTAQQNPDQRQWVPFQCRDRYGVGYRIGQRGLGLASAFSHVYATREEAQAQADLRNQAEGRR